MCIFKVQPARMELEVIWGRGYNVDLKGERNGAEIVGKVSETRVDEKESLKYVESVLNPRIGNSGSKYRSIGKETKTLFFGGED